MERTENIADAFLEETDIKNNDNVLLVMFYGSRANGTSRKNSDLDLLIVINGESGFRAARLFNGVHVDISIMNFESVIQDINSGRANGNMYIESVLLTGEVLYDCNNIYELLLSELDNKSKLKRKINPVFASITMDLLDKYLNSDNDDFYYFNALEFLRQIIHTKFNSSVIMAKKVYSLYTNRKNAKKNYRLKLPKTDFTEGYIEALTEKDAIKRKEILLGYLNIVKNDLKLVPFFSRANDLDLDSLSLALVTLNNLICYVEELLLANHPYATALYNIALYDLDNLIRNNMEVLPTNYDELLNTAKYVTLEEDRIRALENLFMVIDCEYKIDYDDFCIRR